MARAALLLTLAAVGLGGAPGARAESARDRAAETQTSEPTARQEVARPDVPADIRPDVPQPGLKPPAPQRPRPRAGRRFIHQRVACLSDEAVRMGDPTVCLRAPSPDVQWPCVAKYAVVAGDADTCRLLTRDGATEAGLDLQGAPDTASDTASNTPAPMSGARSVAVDLCLSTLALVYRRADLCRELHTPVMDEACLAKLVAHGANPALCTEITSANLRDVCVPDPEKETAE